MALRLRPLDDAIAPAWDAFVAAMPGGTFFHRAAWSRVIATAFGHRCHYTLAEQDGAIVGVLPLAHVKTALFGNTLVSTPFCAYGGPLAVDHQTTRARCADELREKLGASALEMRERQPAEGDWLVRPDLYARSGNRSRVTTQHEGDPPQAARHGAQGYPERPRIGVQPRHGGAAPRMPRACATGTPVFSRRYFTILNGHCRLQRCRPYSTRKSDRVSAELLLSRRVLPYYGGGTARRATCGQ
jgi:hypothetical protein